MSVRTEGTGYSAEQLRKLAEIAERHNQRNAEREQAESQAQSLLPSSAEEELTPEQIRVGLSRIHRILENANEYDSLAMDAITQFESALSRARAREKLLRNALLHESAHCIHPLTDGDTVQWLGVYVLDWGRADEATHGFREWTADEIDARLALPPAPDGGK